MILFYDREGRPLDDASFNALVTDWDYKRIAQTTIGPYWVSTVWLGIDHGWGQGPPVLFETMVFAPDGTLGPDLDCRRYCTEEEARAGHEETVLLIRATYQEVSVEEERPADPG